MTLGKVEVKTTLAQEHKREIILHALVSDQAGDQASHSFQQDRRELKCFHLELDKCIVMFVC